MVRFKTVKFKHYRIASEINERIDKGKATEEEVLRFALSLVAEWDFKDGDTGDPLELGELDELSIEQCREVNELFAQKMGGDGGSPKSEQRSLLLYLNAIKAGREPHTDPPDWLWQIRLAQQYNVLPSAIDEEPMEWVARLIELAYQEGKQGL